MFEGQKFYFSDWGDERGTWKALSPQTLACRRRNGHEWRYTFDGEFKYMFLVDLNGTIVGQGVRVKT